MATADTLPTLCRRCGASKKIAKQWRSVGEAREQLKATDDPDHPLNSVKTPYRLSTPAVLGTLGTILLILCYIFLQAVLGIFLYIIVGIVVLSFVLWGRLVHGANKDDTAL